MSNNDKPTELITPEQFIHLMDLVAKGGLNRKDVQRLKDYLPPLLKAIKLGLDTFPSLEEYQSFLSLPVVFGGIKVSPFALSEEMLAATKIDNIGGNVRVEDIWGNNYMYPPKTKPSLVEVKNSMYVGEALDLLEDHNLVPAKLKELLTFSLNYPDVHLQHDIIALGAISRPNTERCILELKSESDEKVLYLWNHDRSRKFEAGARLLGIEPRK